MLYEKTREAIISHGIREYPREACGYVVAENGKEKYIECKNISPKPGDNFAVSLEESQAIEDKYQVLTFVHTHPDHDAVPSEADRVACEETMLPWVIVSIREGAYAGECMLEPSGWKAPLVGRQFFHGVLDCYTIIRDWYYRDAGILLPDFEREDGWWKKDGVNLYVDNFKKAGFESVGQYPSEYKVGDVILMSCKADRANHAGVFLGSTVPKENPELHKVPNSMLHHMYGRLSNRVVYGGYWLEITTDVLRHKDYKA